MKIRDLSAPGSIAFRVLGGAVVCLAWGTVLLPGADPLDQWSRRNPLPTRPRIEQRFPGNQPDLDQWTWRNPLPMGNRLDSIAFGAGRFAGVGDHGTIVTSSDGTNWIKRIPDAIPAPFNAHKDLHAIAYADGRFVAVGDNISVVSTDAGVTWTRDDWPGQFLFPPSMRGIAHGRGQFVAVGERDDRPVVLTSIDGVDWESQSLGQAGETLGKTLNAVTFGNDLFVAAGDQGTILSSADGINWTDRSPGEEVDLLGVIWGNGLFVAVGTSQFPVRFAQSVVLVSPDGINWTRANSGFTEWLYAVTYANGLFMAAGVSLTRLMVSNGSAGEPGTSKPCTESRSAMGPSSRLARAGRW